MFSYGWVLITDIDPSDEVTSLHTDVCHFSETEGSIHYGFDQTKLLGFGCVVDTSSKGYKALVDLIKNSNKTHGTDNTDAIDGPDLIFPRIDLDNSGGVTVYIRQPSISAYCPEDLPDCMANRSWVSTTSWNADRKLVLKSITCELQAGPIQ